MIAFLLTYYKYILAAVAGFILAWGIGNLRIERLEAKAKETLEAQIRFDIQQCKDSQAVTTKSETEYEAIIAQRDADIKRLRSQPATCVPVTRPARSSDAAYSPKKQDKPNGGVTSGALLDFAGECETDRAKVIGLQSFITEERK